MDRKLTVVICLVLLMVSGNIWLWISLNQANSKITGMETIRNNLQSQISSLNIWLDGNKTQLQSAINERNQLQTWLDDNKTLLQGTVIKLDQLQIWLDENITSYNEVLERYNLVTQPLAFENIPSTWELYLWLTADNTDSLSYTKPNFVCGDFAATLAIRAKEMHWDMGVVAIWGYTESYERYAHAINAIITTTGLVYIEPQNDYSWFYEGHEAIHKNAWFEIDRTNVYVEDVSIIVWYN